MTEPHVDQSLINLCKISCNCMNCPRQMLFALRGTIKNTGELRTCASMKPKYLLIRARPGRFLG
jgi:hypothetical protein